MNNQLSTENMLMINDLSEYKSGIYACKAYNTMTETVIVAIGEYLP